MIPNVNVNAYNLCMKEIKLMCYTRTPLHTDIYSEKLAYSMHLAYSEDGKPFEAFNHNSGILFAKATTNEDGTLTAKTLRNPKIHKCAGGCISNDKPIYFITAERCEADG